MSEPVDHRTFCRVCNAMCGLVVRVRGDAIESVRGDTEHPLSRGYSCAKGRALGALHSSPDRLDAPSLGRGTARRESTWDHVLGDLSDRISSMIDESGPDSVAMYLASGSAFDAAGRRSAERFLRMLGSRQKYTATTIDTPCRPFVAEAMGGWSGLTPIWDPEGSDLVVFVGSNPVVSHGHSNAMPDPVRRLREARARGARVVVIDPRRTETAELADLHLQLRPGTDWLLLAWIARMLLDRDVDHIDVSGAEEVRAALRPVDLGLVARRTDLGPDLIEEFSRLVESSGPLAMLTGTGTTMGRAAVVTEHLAWTILALTGSLDRPGGMWFNPGLFGRLDERDLPSGDGTPEAGPRSRPDLPRRFGEYPCVALLDEIEAGNVRALFVVGGNPALALPDTPRTEAALGSLEVLAVHDILPTRTTDLATHVLAAVDPLERADITWLLDTHQSAIAGQFTHRVVTPALDRRPVWSTFAELADRMGSMLHDVPADTLDEISILEPLLERSAVGAEALRAAQTAIIASGPRHGWVRDRVLPERRWRIGHHLLVDRLRAAIDDAITDGPVAGTLRLIPHRRRSMMNSQFESLAVGSEAIAIEVHDSAPTELGPTGTTVELTTSTGTIRGPIRRTDRLRPDTVALSHGSASCNVSELTSASVDVDPDTAMVLQSGLECALSADSQA